MESLAEVVQRLLDRLERERLEKERTAAEATAKLAGDAHPATRGEEPEITTDHRFASGVPSTRGGSSDNRM